MCHLQETLPTITTVAAVQDKGLIAPIIRRTAEINFDLRDPRHCQTLSPSSSKEYSIERPRLRVTFDPQHRVRYYIVPRDLDYSQIFYQEDDFERFRKERDCLRSLYHLRKREQNFKTQEESCMQRLLKTGLKMLHFIYS